MPHPDDRIAPPRPPQTPAHPAGLSDPPHPHPGEPALRRRRARGAATALFTVIALAGVVADGGWRVANDDGLQAAAGRVAGAGMASLAFFADLALGYDGPPSPEGKIGPVSQSYGRTPAMVAQANAQSLPAQALVRAPPSPASSSPAPAVVVPSPTPSSAPPVALPVIVPAPAGVVSPMAVSPGAVPTILPPAAQRQSVPLQAVASEPTAPSSAMHPTLPAPKPRQERMRVTPRFDDDDDIPPLDCRDRRNAACQ